MRELVLDGLDANERATFGWTRKET